jgi:hypothetical protein
MGNLCTYAGDEICVKVLIGKPEGRRPLTRRKRKWEKNIKNNLKEIVWEGMEWTDLAQDKKKWQGLVNTVRKLNVP